LDAQICYDVRDRGVIAEVDSKFSVRWLQNEHALIVFAIRLCFAYLCGVEGPSILTELNHVVVVIAN